MQRMGDEQPDEELYRRVKDGDLRAFDVLYARHARRLFGFLRSTPLSAADAEDILHESMLATLESAEVSFDQGSFRSWLYRIAHNRVLNRARSQGRGQGALAKLHAVPPERPDAQDDRIAHEERRVALEVAVARLPGSLSDLFRLRSSGLSYEEMAAVLGIPLGTIKSRMNQLVGILRKELHPWTAR